MSEPGGGAALQPDMHLKPLDNAALLKPLRRLPVTPVAVVFPSPAAAPAPPPVSRPPVVKMTTPAPKPAEDGEDDGFYAAAPPVAAPARVMPPQPAQAPAYSAAAAFAPAVATPITKPVPAAEDEDDEDFTSAPAVAAPITKTTPAAEDEDDEDFAPAPPVQASAYVPQPAPAPVYTVPAAFAPAAQTAPAAEDEDDEDFTPAPVWQPTVAPAAVPFAPPRTPRALAHPAAAAEEDDDEDAARAHAALQRPEHSYRPTDEQMHMMELMKSIFASALHAGLGTGQPPQLPVPQAPPPDMDGLRKTLIALQQKIRAAKIPVVIVLEGLSASGKGTMLSRLIEGLDARGYQTHPVRKANCVEETYPALWRYWTSMPQKGDIALFCSSWYGELNKTALNRSIDPEEALPRRLNEIISMESQLICDGTLILKFFLHISQQEQYDRLRKLEKKKSTAWLVDQHDHEQNRRYDETMKGMDDLMSLTNLKGAPWHVLDAADLDDCERQLYGIVIQAFEDALNGQAASLKAWDVPMLPNLSPIPSLGFPPLARFDLSRTLEAPEQETVKDLKKRLNKLQIKLYRRGIPMLIAFEGWDAAGKGGAIRHLNSALDARGFTVVPVSAPTPTELSHHYMWRFWKALPQKGHIAIFDRTWYGRVMVERVENLCTVPAWQRAFEEINRFEKLLTDDGALLCKFWLQIDRQTQLERFEARRDDPEKQWKLTDDDWRNREKWPLYEQALNEVLQRTHTASAPWTVVEANDKEYARYKVLKTVVEAMEKRLGDDPDDD